MDKLREHAFEKSSLSGAFAEIVARIPIYAL